MTVHWPLGLVQEVVPNAIFTSTCTSTTSVDPLPFMSQGEVDDDPSVAEKTEKPKLDAVPLSFQNPMPGLPPVGGLGFVSVPVKIGVVKLLRYTEMVGGFPL